MLPAALAFQAEWLRRVVELLDEQGVPFFSDVDDIASDAIEVITSIQILLSRNDTPLSELTFNASARSRR